MFDDSSYHQLSQQVFIPAEPSVMEDAPAPVEDADHDQEESDEKPRLSPAERAGLAAYKQEATEHYWTKHPFATRGGVIPGVPAAQGLSEETILERLEEVDKGLDLPQDVFELLILILCPDSKELVPTLRDKEPPLPPRPTRTLPGTEERLRVMTWRAENGYALWHPEDPDDIDRVGIAGWNARNGVTVRMKAPLVEQRYREPTPEPLSLGPVGHPAPGTRRAHLGKPEEGFLLTDELTLVTGRLPPLRRRRKKRDGSEYTVTWRLPPILPAVTQQHLFPVEVEAA